MGHASRREDAAAARLARAARDGIARHADHRLEQEGGRVLHLLGRAAGHLRDGRGCHRAADAGLAGAPGHLAGRRRTRVGDRPDARRNEQPTKQVVVAEAVRILHRPQRGVDVAAAAAHRPGDDRHTRYARARAMHPFERLAGDAVRQAAGRGCVPYPVGRRVRSERRGRDDDILLVDRMRLTVHGALDHAHVFDHLLAAPARSVHFILNRRLRQRHPALCCDLPPAGHGIEELRLAPGPIQHRQDRIEQRYPEPRHLLPDHLQVGRLGQPHPMQGSRSG